MRQGTQRDAVLFSVGANASHGLRRTNADKRRAVETLLRDEEWSGWDNVKIARHCAVDEGTVRRYREILSSEFPKIADPNRLVERNGTVYTMNTTNIGRPVAPDPVPEADAPIAESESSPSESQEAFYRQHADLFAETSTTVPAPDPASTPPAPEPAATLIYASTGLAVSKPAGTFFQVTPSGRLAEVPAPTPVVAPIYVPTPPSPDAWQDQREQRRQEQQARIEDLRSRDVADAG